MKMEDIYAIRLERFRRVMIDQFGGKQAAIAKAVGKPANYVSRVLGGSKKLGEDMVREFEETLGKPPYWFDGFDLSSNWPFSAPFDDYSSLGPEKARELDVMVTAFLAGATPTKREEEVA